MLCVSDCVEGAIYIDGQLYSGDVLNIADSSYDDIPILLTGDSRINLYENQGYSYEYVYISLTEHAVANVYYEDQIIEIIDSGGLYGCQPNIRFDIEAHDQSAINLIA